MITFDFPPLTSEMAAWNDSHKSTVSDACMHVSNAGVVTLGWGKIDVKSWRGENPWDTQKHIGTVETETECSVFTHWI